MTCALVNETLPVVKKCVLLPSTFSHPHFLYGLMFFSLLGEIVAKYKTMHLKLSSKIQILPHLFTKVLGNYDEGFVFSLWKQKRKYFVLYVYFA